jgi:gliding motility-associated lipoprotein GldD
MKINNRSFFRQRCLAYLSALTLLIMAFAACTRAYTPKPRSYFRIDFPEKKYILYQSDCSYSFEVPVYAKVDPYRGNHPEPCWLNIDFPDYKGTIHLTYKELQDNLDMLVEDIHTIAYKHIIKADDIIEQPFSFPERKVYGIIYDIKGNTASSFNFYATDSSRNFLSGALYFNVIPNKDSLAPVVSFFSADIEHLIETLNWK